MASPTNQTTYELWLSEDGSYDFFPSTNESARALLAEDARLVNAIEARSWEEARQKQYELLGWGTYQSTFNSSEDISIVDSKGRRTAFNVNELFDRNTVFKLTKISFNQLRWLEKEKIIVPVSDKKRTKAYAFPQILQLQAYVLISQDRNVRIMNNVLKKVLRFYSNSFNKISLHQSFPYSIGSTVKTVEPDLSNANELFDQIKQLDFSNRKAQTVHIYPSMMNVLLALHENAQSIYNIGFDEFRQMLVA